MITFFSTNCDGPEIKGEKVRRMSLWPHEFPHFSRCDVSPLPIPFFHPLKLFLYAISIISFFFSLSELPYKPFKLWCHVATKYYKCACNVENRHLITNCYSKFAVANLRDRLRSLCKFSIREHNFSLYEQSECVNFLLARFSLWT